MIQGLSAGADDFVPKPVRIDELVARVTAHLRKQAAWSSVIEDELRTRATVVAALAHLPISSVPEEAAEAIVNELAMRTESDSVAIFQLGPGDSLLELATSTASTASGEVVTRSRRRRLARSWTARRLGAMGRGSQPGRGRGTAVVADPPAAVTRRGRPDLRGQRSRRDPDHRHHPRRRSVGPRRAGPAHGGRDRLRQRHEHGGGIRVRRPARRGGRARPPAPRPRQPSQFHSVFQPIVDLETRATVGFEALTRFDDGTPPDVRFEEAEAGGLGPDFELATIRSAIEGAATLPAGAFLSINVSPGFVLRADRRFRRLVGDSARPLVLELTEHVPIDDYPRVRTALAKLGAVGLAVDDAGAGYASLRHILELRPTYAKLDISLVRRIDDDDLRQALAAGLQYFAFKTGCRLIAEGVESDGEADVLRRLGVEYGQGYLFGKPALAAA